MLGNGSHIGFTLDQDFPGKCRASEDLLSIGYGLTDRFALEIEAAVIHAHSKNLPNDLSGMPPPRPAASETGDGLEKPPGPAALRSPSSIRSSRRRSRICCWIP